MDKTIGELLVMEFAGLMAVLFVCFYLALLMVKTLDQAIEHAPQARWSLYAGLLALVGLPVYLGLTVFFPDLPRF